MAVVAQGGLNRRLAWEALVEGRPATLARGVGAAMAFAGAARVVLKG